MSGGDDIANLLQNTFQPRNIRAALDHFAQAVEALQRENWETTITKVGKFVEAVLKALYAHVGETLPPSRSFKVDGVIEALRRKPQASFEDSIRLTIPRACRFAYDIASNRGARHDPDEVDPNQMDATVLTAVCSWILAELVRCAEKGAIQPDRAREMVNGLIVPRYPLIEKIDGRAYFHAASSARDAALALLEMEYPKRMNRQRLVDGIQRHNFNRNAAQVAVTRLRGLVDDDGDGNLCLLAPGRQEAERLLKKGSDRGSRRTRRAPPLRRASGRHRR